MAGYKAHTRQDVTAKGAFIFRKTGVEYGHDGIKNLRRRIELPSRFLTEFISGSSVGEGYNLDGGTSRVPLKFTSGGVAVIRAYQRFQLPPDFGAFDEQAIDLYAKRSAAITRLEATLLKAGVADAGVNAVSVSPSGSGVWEFFQLTPTGSYAPRDWLTLQLELELDSTVGTTVELADVGSEYVSGRGHAL